MSEVEERVAATAQTCADAVKVIALKHASISAMFAEVQASQAAADNRLAQLSKQLSSARASRGSSRGNSRPSSRTLSSTGVLV
ncbi:hypothetical protein OEZ86_002366 [Tetradesmus obliquus]|nr:hypothetical protein OEZ85_011506 [Tetradesmus obliquus]WIA31473.1 hypothetical protein OEZ86_002366 [Tetradesmus obliquus]